MSASKSLNGSFSYSSNYNYNREDNVISNETIKGGIDYLITGAYTNGIGADNKANLLFHKKYSIGIGATETLDLNGNTLVDIWGETLNFATVKSLILHNIELVSLTGRIITFTWGGESAIIAGGGHRVLTQTSASGIGSVLNDITLTAGSEATDIVVIMIGNDDVAST